MVDVSKPEPWSFPPDQLALGASDVHVWLVSLQQPTAVAARFADLLSLDEKTRADRFVFDVDHRNYTIARGCLRTILSRYLRIAPEKIDFIYGEYGKPDLANSSGPSQLKFNVAHSGVLALYAFTSIGEVGIDLECIRPDFAVDEVARRFFSPGEVACLDQFHGPMRREAFYRCWTRKEAFIKAKRLGLSLELNQFEVTLASDKAAVLRTRWDENEAARWTLQDIDVGPGYVGALAIEAHGWKLSRFSIR